MRRRLLSNLSALASNAVLPPATTLFARSPMRLLWTPAGAPPPRPRWATANTRARPTAPALHHQARRSVCASAARRADASADAPPSPAPSDLRSVPGVGAKTELLLLASGIGCVADLSRVYYGEAAASTKAMVSYLQVRKEKKGGGRAALLPSTSAPRTTHHSSLLCGCGGGGAPRRGGARRMR